MITYDPRVVANFSGKMKVLDEIVLRECSLFALIRVWGGVG